MRRAVPVCLAMWVLVVVALCNCASAGIMGVASVDYQYHVAAKGGTWTVVGTPGYEAPEWFTIPTSRDQWIAIPNQDQSGEATQLWFQVQWDSAAVVPANPVVWVPQGVAVTGGTSPTHVGNAYVWEWTITPQSGSEVLQIPSSFPWAGVTGMDIAARSVPEPSAIVGLVTSGLCGLLMVWRQKKTA
jgi:hypothetical protein